MLKELVQAKSWIASALVDSLRPAPGHDASVDLILCIADHFEPKGGGADAKTAIERCRRFARDYPDTVGAFRDSDGASPRHSFFYPEEEYEERLMEPIAEL